MRKSIRWIVKAIWLFWVVAPAGAFQPVDTQTTGQPLAPPEALARLRVPEGFRVTLAAAEPDVRQPIALAYDGRGRVWVAESYSYKGADFTDETHDRLVIFDDQDGDGVFETRKVFYDRLNRLTGLTLGFGGVWVATAPTVQFIPDRDRNDVPDGAPEVVLDGWTLSAEHNSVNGLFWGPDGWLYGRHGIKSPSRPGVPGTPEAQRPTVSCAIWRYHPVWRVFDVVAEGSVNPWGFDFDDRGQMFMSSSVVDHLWHVVPGAKFKRWLGRETQVYPHLYDLMDPANDHSHREPDANGVFAGGHSHTAATIYLGDRWPEEYRGSLFMSNIHGRRINRDTLRVEDTPVGRAVASHAPDFLVANDPWFRAVSFDYGPDGDVVMSDWSDFGECHDRDGVHRSSGRLYKITYGKPLKITVDVDAASSAQLVAWQFHRNDWYVRQARRVLQERASQGEDMAEVHRQLLAEFEATRPVERRLRSLWALYVTQGAHGGSKVCWTIRSLIFGIGRFVFLLIEGRCRESRPADWWRVRKRRPRGGSDWLSLPRCQLLAMSDGL
ncbi:MAG TPA: hypothetical protein PLN52_23925 [Opitutaceae bacterium]|nr:hypothetical protein [Opitutaceae bacterium]